MRSPNPKEKALGALAAGLLREADEEGTCGALTGACILAGLKNSTGNLAKPDSKQASYKLSREIVRQFLAESGATACKDLKGVETGKVLRACPDCIRGAAAIAERVLFAD